MHTKRIPSEERKEKTHALRAEPHIYLTHHRRIDQSGRGSTSIDSTQESLTGGLWCRIVGEGPRLHSRKHVCRVRVFLRGRRAPSRKLWQRRYRWGHAITKGRLSKSGIESGGLCKQQTQAFSVSVIGITKWEDKRMIRKQTRKNNTDGAAAG